MASPLWLEWGAPLDHWLSSQPSCWVWLLVEACAVGEALRLRKSLLSAGGDSALSAAGTRYRRCPEREGAPPPPMRVCVGVDSGGRTPPSGSQPLAVTVPSHGHVVLALFGAAGGAPPALEPPSLWAAWLFPVLNACILSAGGGVGGCIAAGVSRLQPLPAQSREASEHMRDLSTATSVPTPPSASRLPHMLSSPSLSLCPLQASPGAALPLGGSQQ